MTNDQSLLGEMKEPEIPAGYFKKLFTGVVDGGIVLAIYYMLYRFLPYDFQVNTIRTVNPTVIAFLLLFIYRVIMIFGFKQQTLGMMVFKVKFLTKDEEELSITQKWRVVFLLFMNDIKYFNKTA